MELRLIAVNECGEELTVRDFIIGNELDEDYIKLWKSMKIERYKKEYPEYGFYFENRTTIKELVNELRHGVPYGYEPIY